MILAIFFSFTRNTLIINSIHWALFIYQLYKLVKPPWWGTLIWMKLCFWQKTDPWECAAKFRLNKELWWRRMALSIKSWAISSQISSFDPPLKLFFLTQVFIRVGSCPQQLWAFSSSFMVSWPWTQTPLLWRRAIMATSSPCVLCVKSVTIGSFQISVFIRKLPISLTIQAPFSTPFSCRSGVS